jgi:hypothetical protein
MSEPVAPRCWDFYEITFSVDGDEDAALALFEQFEKLPGVTGACFAAGNYSEGSRTAAKLDEPEGDG